MTNPPTDTTGGTTGPQPNYASAAAVAGLAREVEALRRAIDPLSALPAQVDELARVVTHLAEEVAAKAQRAAVVHAPSWLDLPGDIRAATTLLHTLVSWMGEVYLRYADAVQFLPACWLWHPDVVEELLWLMHAWLAAYREENASVAAAGDWHDRYRPGVVRRIKTLAGTCSLENHQPRGDDRRGGRPVVPIGEAMQPITAWWAQHRDQPPPEPTDEQLAAASALPRRGGGRR